MENFLDMLSDKQIAGGGSACLRTLTLRGMSIPDSMAASSMPRAVGIPSGWSADVGGFRQMDRDYVKKAIDISVERIALLFRAHKYDRI
eukprot:6587551-Prymnesium_polylepis.1